MGTENAVEESGRKSARASDWVWTLYPAIAFGLAALAVVLAFPGGGIERVSPSYDVFRVDLFITRWFLCYPILLMTPFLALWFVRTGGLERLRRSGDSFLGGRPWWIMTGRAALCHGTLLAFLLTALVIVTYRMGRWRGVSLASDSVIAAAAIGILHIAGAAGVLLPNCLFTFTMHRHGERGYRFCGMLFSVAHAVGLVLSIVTVWSWGYPYGLITRVLESPAVLFFLALCVANLPLLLVVPLLENEDGDDPIKPPAGSQRRPGQYHGRLAIASMVVFVLLYTGLFVYLEPDARRHLGQMTHFSFAAGTLLPVCRTIHPAYILFALPFIVLGQTLAREFYPNTLGKPNATFDRIIAIGWLTITVSFLVLAYGTIVCLGGRIWSTFG